MVELLNFAEGEPFASGAIEYLYQPDTFGETTSRILLTVKIERFVTTAVVGTGAPYVVCPHGIVEFVPLDPENALKREKILIRGSWVGGFLYRLTVEFTAEIGESLQTEVTAFVSDIDWQESWGNLPAFIGLSGCLERMRFAVDPGSDTFYFGSL